MSPSDFCYWLEGFLTQFSHCTNAKTAGLNHDQVVAMAAKLARVRRPEHIDNTTPTILSFTGGKN